MNGNGSLYDSHVARILAKSGWFPARNVEASHYLSLLESKGYVLNKNASNVLRNMGGLILTHESYSNPEETDVTEINPAKPSDWLDPKWVHEVYEKIAQDTLCPVGLGFSEHMVFFISSLGKFYGGYDDYFCLIGDTIENALNNLFFKHQFIAMS